MKVIFVVMNTTWAVVKIRPEKKFQACTGFEPMTSDQLPVGLLAQLVSHSSWVQIPYRPEVFFSGLIFTIAQVVFMTEYFFGGFDNLLGLQGEVISHKPNRSPEWPGFFYQGFLSSSHGLHSFKGKGSPSFATFVLRLSGAKVVWLCNIAGAYVKGTLVSPHL